MKIIVKVMKNVRISNYKINAFRRRRTLEKLSVDRNQEDSLVRFTSLICHKK